MWGLTEIVGCNHRKLQSFHERCDAVCPPTTGSANVGLYIGADLAGTTHYRGWANQNPDGSYYIEGLDGYLWSDGFLRSDGFLWSDGLTETMSTNMWVDQQ